ncbi:WH2 domain-containing protein [Wolbachia endosymbiont of Dirofilaria (Dirofilaria) immitis]|uniref:hypothetical protein n=1 Tax=Wolbachia endosymbiont of Dirofilaria (Dirofilaria) immitis TaxID=1812115 RepID=UPI00158BA859|nr:hypothetical protein [Wolbachia endosymbiont of Dirofilaria (Dirofilaria) immitis]QKX02538.1 hypothetical protein GOY12_03225 [Wolbachia endosymbiont of Dirofilaria (Dirofilaria) immitis]
MYTSNATLSEGSADHWRLIKTRLTIFQPLITILTSSVLSFIAGQYLPCVTATTSSSSITTAAPLIIFTISAVVTLVLVTNLIKLSLSRVYNKKEVGLSKGVLNKEQQSKKMIKKSVLESEPIGERLNKTFKKQGSGAQIEVVNSSINSNGKSSASYTPIQLSLTPSTAVQQTDTIKPLHSVVPPFSFASGLNGIPLSKRTNSSNMLEAGVSNDINQENSKDILLEQIKKGVKLRHTKNINIQQKQPGTTNQNQDMVLVLNIALAQRRIAIKSSDSESEHFSSNSSSGWSTDEERLKKKRG